MADEERAASQTPAPPSPSPEELLLGEGKKKRLGPWYATAICGNDITSSCLYASGIAIFYAGPLAPLALLLAVGVLYLYRRIYTEVVEALPLDGGVYNCLINCTRKFDASFAACLTLLSYLATAVISAKTAVVFVRLGSLPRLVRAFSYIDRNEASQNVLIIRLYAHDDPAIEEKLQKNLEVIRELYPYIKIEYQARQGKFNPETVEALSHELDVPKNMMFMGSLTEKQTFSVMELGGVRVIF